MLLVAAGGFFFRNKEFWQLCECRSLFQSWSKDGDLSKQSAAAQGGHLANNATVTDQLRLSFRSSALPSDSKPLCSAHDKQTSNQHVAKHETLAAHSWLTTLAFFIASARASGWCKRAQFQQRTYPSSESGSKSSRGESDRSGLPSSGASAIIGMLVSLVHASQTRPCGQVRWPQRCRRQNVGQTMNHHHAVLELLHIPSEKSFHTHTFVGRNLHMFVWLFPTTEFSVDRTAGLLRSNFIHRQARCNAMQLYRLSMFFFFFFFFF